MKYILIFLTIFLIGCTSSVKKSDYLVTTLPTIVNTTRFSKVVAVSDIELPYYLQDGKIPHVVDGKIEFFDSYFADDAEEFIKKRAIYILKNRFKDAFDYPWKSKSADLILKIYIKKFITVDKTITLEASYEFYTKKKKLVKKDEYQKSKKLKDVDEKEILRAMEKLFDEFIYSITL